MYVFLGFDGVLNSGRFLDANKDQLRRHKDCQLVFDREAMGLFNTFIACNPDIEIVISSDWRKARNFDVLAKRMVMDGFGHPDKVIGQTPNYGRAPRGNEIHAWLMARNLRGKPFVVLDDRGDMDAVDSHLVQTDAMVGLTRNDVRKATAVLSQGRPRKRRAA